ncbi:helix-turn-helix domain-containing protein [Natrarchaeobaculum sulfurireducens]|uniref:Bacterio-opsin activator domain-containing protein n=1 Tax=Natrarchaeobaculum sulfurireducens TaxID=2044521 RepID=A0A346PR62_9EURY|nr:helix-turn-helix domain-containing protein [Natrarchaeobaculum sulfurireducens]AXR82007.1 Bacterio-opsin activator domain-containing protein [Natrarchaeobaculum sulfurireducens]
MTTVVELDVPAGRLGLARTFDHVPAFGFQIGAIIGDAPPLVRVSGSDRQSIERSLEDDPSVDVLATVSVSADESTRSESTGPFWVFRLEFTGGLELFQRLVASADGAVLSARGREGIWSLQLLFHDRESVSTCYDLFERYEFDVEVTRLTGMDDLERVQTPLTETQYETICTAHDLGYFDVPRAITLEELAAELDVSHQALSERLRRSQAALISAELSGGLDSSPIDP